MRILALLTDAFGAGGGIAQYNRDLMTALALSPLVEEIVALPRFGSATAEVPAKIRQLPPATDRLVWSSRATVTAIAERPDLILCGHLNAVPLAAAIAQLLSRPLWLQVHGIEAWAPRGLVIRRAAETARLVTAVSRFTRHKLISWCDIAPERVRVLPNTIAAAHTPRSRRTDLVERHGLADSKVILTVGRMASSERYKGHDRLVRCLPTVRARVPNAVNLIVGSGDDQSRLEALARELRVEDAVVFTGPVPAAELADYYALADVFAMPSTGEGFGIVFLEAAANGLPVIGGNRDGSVDPLADGAIGKLIDPVDASALVDALVVAIDGRIRSIPGVASRFEFANFSQLVHNLVQTIAH
jgi:phosphatidylinositol alpha-1,6-mannosyltransferase